MLHPSTDNWIGGSHCTKQIGVPAKNVAGMAKKVRRSVVASEVSEGVKTLAFCGHVRKSRTRPLRIFDEKVGVFLGFFPADFRGFPAFKKTLLFR